jgi:hypothetical protein
MTDYMTDEEILAWLEGDDLPTVEEETLEAEKAAQATQLAYEIELNKPAEPIVTGDDELDELLTLPVTIPTPIEFTKIAGNLEVKRMCDDEEKYLVRTEYPFNKFLVFDSRNEFYTYMQAQPAANRQFHEVVYDLPMRPLRKFAVDIDASTQLDLDLFSNSLF